ncbi:MAG TPA: FapA family protein [Clostridia bacterium]|nr:FapA family protein [Clostridia bacterium]
MTATTAENTGAVNASVKVILSTDSMTAVLWMTPPESGGNSVSGEMIEKALKDAGVIQGIDKKLVEVLGKQPVYSKEIPIANGVDPVDGQNGKISYRFQISTQARPKVNSDGTVDYHDLGIIQNVRKGDVLCDITPPTPGSDGFNVRGRVIKSKAGKPVSSPNGKNTALSEDKSQLISTINGHVMIMGTKVVVNDTFIVSENVDNSTGNIKFVGNVSVIGAIKEGFVVEAEGNVEVSGSILGGSIIAGGNITVRGGVVGMNRSTIKSKGDFSSTFLENCAVSAGGQVKASSIMNCNINCGRTMELTGYNSKLIGGHYVVGGDIIAHTIGSPSNIPTDLVLGANPSLVTLQRSSSKQLKEIHSQIQKLEQIIRLLDRYKRINQLPPDKEEIYNNSVYSYNDLQTKLQSLTEQVSAYNEEIMNSDKGKVVCKGTAYRGVKITIGFARLNILEPVFSSSFKKEDTSITINNISPY